MSGTIESIVFTIGYSTRRLAEFIELLQENRGNLVIDIRTVPRSRYNPQFNKDTLPVSLQEAGIAYRHMVGLGGLRHPRPDSLNQGWRNDSFRGFADYMPTPEFQDNLEQLISLASEKTIVLMCAEAVPWRCHRSLIADALTIRGIMVEHIMGKHSLRAHTLTPWALVSDGHITYPAFSHI